jgi:diguanylate cyclase (GGDEF)-like protein
MPFQKSAKRATLPEALARLILTDIPKQRRCLGVLLLTTFVYAICIAVTFYGVHTGMFVASDVSLLRTGCALATVPFYVAIRSGWNQRFADKTLALPQALVAQTLVACAYATTGIAHGSTLALIALVMIFGMFNMRVRGVRIMAVYTVSLMGGVMAWKAHTDPAVYPPNLEIIHFAIVATVLPAISALSLLLADMHKRLKLRTAELQRALTHDELTGLANRRHMMDVLREHTARQDRGGPDFYIAMADLDLFKNINDTYGHAVGDEVLRGFGMQARSVLRATDVVGRWGGEEFLLLLPETPPPGEPTVGLERLRSHLDAYIVYPQVPGLRVHFSAGFARHAQGEPIDQTIERADRALYAAKAAGRNRSVVL